MSGTPAVAVVAGALADAGLKATAVIALAGLVNHTGQRWTSAAQRHVVWLAALSSLPVLLLAAAFRGPAVAVDGPAWLGVWAVGVVASAVGPLRGWLRLRRLRTAAVGDEANPGVGYVQDLDGPITWGVVRPQILLPVAARSWTASARDAALVHERAHVARWDWCAHVWAGCVETLFWFHPLVRHARRQLVAEAEHAADDIVLASGVRASDYAALLLTLARPSRPEVALGMGRSLLGPRIRAVLEARPRGTTRAGTAMLAALTAAAAVTVVGPAALWTTPAPVAECAPAPPP
jgi:beta-lactamase regulating signal transducer with metallopeptidase domain